jgi:S1-C subfamily serine protease
MQQMSYCPNCRATVDFNSQFCGNCGSYINRLEPGYQPMALPGNPSFYDQQPPPVIQPEWSPYAQQQPPPPVTNQLPPYTKPETDARSYPGQVHYPFIEEKSLVSNNTRASVPPFIWVVIFLLIAFDVAGLATDWSFFGDRTYEPQIAIQPVVTKPLETSPVIQQQILQPPGPPLVTLPSFTGLISAVSPSVVSVDTEMVSKSKYAQRITQGAGSGWVYDESGIIVTNAHVIEGAKTISIEMKDGKTYTPVSVKIDPLTDLAIMRINAGGKLPALKIGNASALKVGDWVVVIGNPLGMGISVKHGIVSRMGVGISLASENYTNLIETDAPINPGNSGGPVTNLAGEVIGIASLKLSTAGVEGMGYAISMVDALPVIQQLAKQ